MASFLVNGRTVTAERNQKLIRFLRDELRLTSVKDGCSEGACGTCTVIADGEAVRACVLLEVPAKVLCREDCKGLCPVCGANLNHGTCTCQEGAEVTNPFSALKSIVLKDEEV